MRAARLVRGLISRDGTPSLSPGQAERKLNPQREFDVTSPELKLPFDPDAVGAGPWWEFRMKAPSARVLRTGAVIFLGVLVVCAGGPQWTTTRAQSSQTHTPPAPAPANPDAGEVASEESPGPLRMVGNPVPARVIVRAAKGKAVSTLHKDDF